MSMLSATFWKRAVERAVKTAAQVVVGMLSADHVLGLLDVDVIQVVSVAGLSLVLSLLTSVASAPAHGDSENPSVVK